MLSDCVSIAGLDASKETSLSPESAKTVCALELVVNKRQSARVRNETIFKEKFFINWKIMLVSNG